MAVSDPRAISPDALWRRPVLIGNTQTLRGLAVQLENSGISPAACIDIEAREGARRLEALPTIHAVHPFTVALVSIPTAAAPAILKVRSLLRSLGIIERFVPAFADLVEGTAVRPALTSGIDLVELIGRTPYGIDRRAVARVLEGKRVLITGAGGSIGSELCRIVATFKPELLIMMERSENALFEVDRRIARRFPDVPRKAVLHDVVDAEQTLRHLVALKPHAIFHAAAHKHVPLMEDHPSHAVTNNLFGTKSIADAAAAVGAERFVMISSDKAVNPTSVMGATKRLAEMYVQSLGATARPRAVPGGGGTACTTFSMVRFGNVLGSACSVLEIWGNQLAEGGPITVTDPRMTRYFMTINEAATLVIQAGAIDAKPGLSPSIFVLDMGAPLHIADLAQRFVRLHGFQPKERKSERAKERELKASKSRIDIPAPSQAANCIDIVFTGARPGEKVHEELAYAAEALLPTPYPGIMALASSTHADFDVAGMIADFSALRSTNDRAAVVSAIRRHVPEMVPEADTAQRASTGSRTMAA
jgi:FlaA1/EpsC-like NDP-sugar epimerase